MKRENFRMFETYLQTLGRQIDDVVFSFFNAISRIPEEALKNYLREKGCTDKQIEEFLKYFKTIEEG